MPILITIPINEVDCAADLFSVFSTPSITPDDPNLCLSTKKRKNFLIEEDKKCHSVTLQPNDTLAKLRLLLWEQCGKSPLHQQLFLSRTKDPPLVELDAEWNDRTMSDIFADSGCRLEDIMCMYLRHGEEEDQNKKIKEKQILGNSIVDSLTEVAFGYGENEDTLFGDSKRKKSAKRGSRRTLLQYATSLEAGNEYREAGGSILNRESTGKTRKHSKGSNASNPLIVKDTGSNGDKNGVMDVSNLNDAPFSPGSKCMDVISSKEGRIPPMPTIDECIAECNDDISLFSEDDRAHARISSPQKLSPSQNEPVVARQPTSKHDLTPSALLFTSPIYGINNKTTLRISSPTQEDNDIIVPIDNMNCKLEQLDAELACIFISEAKHINHKAQSTPEALSELSKHVPRYVPPNHMRHLYRNFIDSVDPITPVFKKSENPPVHLCISRRELDIMLYFASIEKNPKDFHHLMPYRNLMGLRHVYRKVKLMEYHKKDNEYMRNVRRCVETIIRLEEDPE